MVLSNFKYTPICHNIKTTTHLHEEYPTMWQQSPTAAPALPYYKDSTHKTFAPFRGQVGHAEYQAGGFNVVGVWCIINMIKTALDLWMLQYDKRLGGLFVCLFCLSFSQACYEDVILLKMYNMVFMYTFILHCTIHAICKF